MKEEKTTSKLPIYLNFFLLLVLLVFALYSYNKITAIESRYNTHIAKIEANTLKPLIINEKDFREDYYITQLEQSSNLILMCFGAALVLFGLFSYHNVEQIVKVSLDRFEVRYKTFISGQQVEQEKVKKSYEDNEQNLTKNFTKLEEDLIKIVVKINKEIAFMHYYMAKNNFEIIFPEQKEGKEASKEEEMEKYIYHELKMCGYHAENYKLRKQHNPEAAAALVGTEKDSIARILYNVSGLAKKAGGKIKIHGKLHILDLVNNIRDIRDPDIDDNINRIYAYLEFTDEENPAKA